MQAYNIKARVFLLIVSLYGFTIVYGQTAVNERKTVDFVHDESVFDMCYPVYRRVTELLETGHILPTTGNVAEDSIRRGLRLFSGNTHARIDGWLRDVDDSTHETFVKGLSQRNYYARDLIYSVCLRYHTLQADTNYNEAVEKARLVKQIEAFRDTAVVLPSIYVQIDNEFGGSVPRYVDALFSNSALTDRVTMRRVCGKPTVERMQRDMGFQFVVSKLMYRAWEKQNRFADDGTCPVVQRSELEKR